MMLTWKDLEMEIIIDNASKKFSFDSYVHLNTNNQITLLMAKLRSKNQMLMNLYPSIIGMISEI